MTLQDTNRAEEKETIIVVDPLEFFCIIRANSYRSGRVWQYKFDSIAIKLGSAQGV
jgi:hypothetical protein